MPLTLLCCDTSTQYAVFALAEADGTLKEYLAARHGRDLSRRFFGLLDDLFAAAGIGLENVDALAAGIGPGSFTGVRVAVATLSTLALATGKPLVGVGTLDAFGAFAASGLEREARAVAVLPSRRDEVYAAVYAGGDGAAAEPPFVATHKELAGRLARLAANGPVLLCGAVSALSEEFAPYPRIPLEYPPAESLARLAAQAIAHGRLADPAAFTPLYVALPAISQHKSRSS